MTAWAVHCELKDKLRLIIVNKLKTKKEAAEILAVSERTIDRLVSEGRLRAVKVRGAVRFTDTELERFVTKNTTKAGV